jgi:hypothetical protein
LYYLKSRYYDPQTGRFISQDEVSYLDPEHINGLILYAYCGNNPVMRVDPNGNVWYDPRTWDWGAIAVAAVAVLSVGAIIVGAILIGTGVGAPIGAILISAGVGGLIGGGASIVSQGITKGWENINWGQVAIDGLFGVASGAIGASPWGLVATMIAGGVIGFTGSVLGDLVANNWRLSKVDWVKAAIMTVIGVGTAWLGAKGTEILKRGAVGLGEIIGYGADFLMLTKESSSMILREIALNILKVGGALMGGTAIISILVNWISTLIKKK